MSFIELLIILFIAIGILDKNKIQSIYKTLKKIQNGPSRKIVGDESLEENWIWIDRADTEEE